MNFRVVLYVYDKNENIIGRHTFIADNKNILYGVVLGFKSAMKEYKKDCIITNTMVEIDKEDE